MMHDDWHTTTYLTYHDGQQAVTGHWRCHWDRRLCSRPPGSALADFTRAQHDGNMGGFPFFFVHFISASFLFTLASNFYRKQRAIWAKGFGFSKPRLSLKCLFPKISTCEASDWI